jgi:hypothetical protein
MTDKDAEAFRQYMLKEHDDNGEQIREYSYHSMEDLWNAARERYTPKLSEKEAVEVAYQASQKTSEDDWKEFMAEMVAALRAAGVRFREEA